MVAVASNCIFIADYGYFQSPLDGYPITPLGLPIDIWYVYDSVSIFPPFVPYVAFGDIVFVATNGYDVTIRDGAIILVIYYF